MHPHPSRTYLYKRVKLLTNLGEHDRHKHCLRIYKQGSVKTPHRIIILPIPTGVDCQSRARAEAGGSNLKRPGLKPLRDFDRTPTEQGRQHGPMPKNNQPLVDRHPQKEGEGWLLNEQEQLVVCFRNTLPSAHGQWVEVETRPLRGGGQAIVRRMLRHNAIEAWINMQKTGWVRCQPRW